MRLRPLLASLFATTRALFAALCCAALSLPPSAHAQRATATDAKAAQPAPGRVTATRLSGPVAQRTPDRATELLTLLSNGTVVRTMVSIDANGRSVVKRLPLTGQQRLSARLAPPPPRSARTPDYVIQALDDRWDLGVDGDTLVVPVGSQVRWHLVSGIHTITDGRGADDPAAGSSFDYLLDAAQPDFDTTFTAPDTVAFFCVFKEPLMRAVLVVSGSASVPEPGLPTTIRFTRPPSPNPSRGGVSFAIVLPEPSEVVVEVWDVAGRRIAEPSRGQLGAGEHSFQWNGLDARGAPAEAGAYRLRVRAGAYSVTRPFALLH